MTDFDQLYSEFHLHDSDSKRLTELHNFSQSGQQTVEKIIVKTAIVDATGAVILKEESDAQLV